MLVTLQDETLVCQQAFLHQLYHPHPSQHSIRNFPTFCDVTCSLFTYRIITMCIEHATILQAIALIIYMYIHILQQMESRWRYALLVGTEEAYNKLHKSTALNSSFGDHLGEWFSNGVKWIGTGSNTSEMRGYFAFTILLTVFLNLPFLWKRKRE